MNTTVAIRAGKPSSTGLNHASAMVGIFQTVNIAMNKLCYIDQHASFKYYLHSMTNLEAAFPQTVFVYTDDAVE